MKRKIVLLIIIIFFSTGCTTKYEKSDIEEFVQKIEAFDKKGSTFKVSDESFIVIGSDTYEDIVWTVNAKVDNQSFKFYVINNYYWGMESISNSLDSTFNYHAYLNNKNDKKLFDYEFIYNDNEYTKEKNKNIDSSILKELNIGINGFDLYKGYKTINEFNTIFDEVNNILDRTTKTVWKPRLCFNIYYDSKYRNNVDGYPLDEADFNKCSSKRFDNKVKEEVKNNFITMNLDYKFNDISDIFTDNEINKAISNYEHRIGLANNSEHGYKLIPDLIQSKFSYGISFGTIYELLKRDNQMVSGDPTHYKYYKNNGDVYEFSYSFNDFYYDKSNKYGYYYLKNGEKISMGAYFYNHLRVNKVKEITDIDLVDVRFSDKKGFYTIESKF